jgi:hypothetical protein
MNEPSPRRLIDLHRRVCVVDADRIDIRPARSAAIAPLIGFFVGVFAFVAVLFWLEELPFVLALVLMGLAIVIVPFSGMGFVYSVYGANVVVDRRKQSVVWQQGFLGMGVGTEEVAPFWKIERLELDEASRDPQEGGPQDFAQYDITLVKVSGKRMPIGQVTVPRYMASEGLARAREAAEAVAGMVEKPLVVHAGEPEAGPDASPRRRYRRQEQAAAGEGAESTGAAQR